MKSKVLHADGTRTIALVFESGEDPVQGLLDFAKRERLSSGHFTAIGAFEDVTLGYFEWASKDYARIPIREQVEVRGTSPGCTPTWSWANGTAPRTADTSWRRECARPWRSSSCSPPDISRAASTPGPSWR